MTSRLESEVPFIHVIVSSTIRLYTGNLISSRYLYYDPNQATNQVMYDSTVLLCVKAQ